MANERIKNQLEPISPEVVGQTIANAISTSTNITQKIYVGPNILGLPRYTVVETGFTAHINGFIEKCPEIEKLFVPIANMAEVENRTKVKGTLENRYFNAIREFHSATREGAN